MWSSNVNIWISGADLTMCLENRTLSCNMPPGANCPVNFLSKVGLGLLLGRSGLPPAHEWAEWGLRPRRKDAELEDFWLIENLPCVCWNERLSLGADDLTACFVAKDEELGSWTTFVVPVIPVESTALLRSDGSSVMFFSFDAPLLCDDKSSMGVVTKITPGGIESSSSSVSESSLSVSV